MPKRIPWRLLLPAINVVLFAILAVIGARPRLLSAILQEGTHIPWTFENPFYELETAPRLLAVGINAPAFICAALILGVLRISNERFGVAALFAMAPFVAVLWYLTGRWCDRRTGNLPTVTQPHSRLRWLIVAASAVALVLAVSVFRTVYFLGGGIAGWHGETPFIAAITYGLAAWSSLWSVMLLAAIGRCRKHPNPDNER